MRGGNKGSLEIIAWAVETTFIDFSNLGPVFVLLWDHTLKNLTVPRNFCQLIWMSYGRPELRLQVRYKHHWEPYRLTIARRKILIKNWWLSEISIFFCVTVFLKYGNITQPFGAISDMQCEIVVPLIILILSLLQVQPIFFTKEGNHLTIHVWINEKRKMLPLLSQVAVLLILLFHLPPIVYTIHETKKTKLHKVIFNLPELIRETPPSNIQCKHSCITSTFQVCKSHPILPSRWECNTNVN